MATSITLRASSPILSAHHFSNASSNQALSAQADCAAPTISAPQPRRPKLSLNTAAAPHPRSFGRGNTGLRLDTLANLSSPTTRNTFRNTYDTPPPANGSPSRNTRPPFTTTTNPTPLSITPSSSVTSTSQSSTDSFNSNFTQIPYTIPHHIRPILRNTPIPRRQPVVTNTPTSSSSRTLLFPPTRRVAFRPSHSLCEEINTTRYTARHQDLLEEDQPASTDILIQTPARRSECAPPACTLKKIAIDPQLLAECRGKQSNEDACTGDKRESSSPDSGNEDEASDGDQFPKTPVAGRAKKRREWVWTLGELNGANATSTPIGIKAPGTS
ncbi:hypothetical protein FH972_023167 [Carpinus fangiana]|uniref:Uncharacterized protein n=1 Tax=Carpinus fangiana TaxID=176857 RepID=A0A5N6KV04_9ROSI|nr:hypothetical protein FH972_023167 [Carpinus fangiana]